MKLIIYQVDAFANRLFAGNPAAVIPLDQWIDEALMQNLAMENNLAETVFFVPVAGKAAEYEIRWFTPELEINLCGHATLASAWVLWEKLGCNAPTVTFHSKSGPLKVTKQASRYEMDFPSWKPERISDYPEDLARILGVKEIVGVYKYRDLLVEVNTEAEVRAAAPDFTALKKTGQMVILTSRGDHDTDFVSRFFAPSAGVDEDPVTGSAHSQLIPFWSEKLGQEALFAKQLSKRGGTLWCKQLQNERVLIAGECVFFMKGEVEL